MELTQLHLTLAHVPILGTLFGIILLVYGIISKNDVFKKAGLVTFIVTAIIAIPVFLTGDTAKETIKNLPGISKNVIDTHEELAEKAIWLIELLGAISLVGFYFAIKSINKFKIIVLIILLVSIITLGTMAVIGNSGGNIRHSEIVNTASSVKN